MKTLLELKSLGLATLLTLFAICGYAGGSGTGGGFPSLIDQQSYKVLIESPMLKKALVHFIETIPLNKISDEQVKQTLLRITKQELIRDIQTSSVYVTSNQKCKDFYNQSVPASTKIGVKGSKICFDTAEIADDVQKSAAGSNDQEKFIRVASLALHEHIHHFQNRNVELKVNEDEAYRVSAYLGMRMAFVQEPLLKFEDFEVAPVGVAFQLVPNLVDNNSPEAPKTQDQARAICEKRGLAIPTAREMATYLAVKGAKGIIEISRMAKLLNLGQNEVLKLKAVKIALSGGSQFPQPSEYDLVETRERDGKIDRFYFSREGYRNTDIGSSWNFTDSNLLSDPNFAYWYSAEYGGLSIMRNDGKSEGHSESSGPYMNVQCIKRIK